jgi:hypothetical protein
MPQTIPGSGVRPTRSALADLGVSVPTLGVTLEDVDHELVARAQQVPERVAAGGATRIISLDDLIWFKVKTETWRGAATRHAVRPVDGDADESTPLGCWWLGAAGTRRQDSGQDDFYEQLERSCIARRKAANAAGEAVRSNTLSTHLLPAPRGYRSTRSRTGHACPQVDPTGRA